MADGGTEIARFALHLQQIGGCQDLDVAMAAGLHQLGRKDAHRAVVGGKRLVELGHLAANGWRALDEVDFDTRVSQVQGRLDSSDATTHHERCSYCFDVCRFRHWVLLRRNSCPLVEHLCLGV